MLDTPETYPRHIFYTAFDHPVYLYPAYKDPLSALEFNPRKKYARIGSLDESESSLYVETYNLDPETCVITESTIDVDTTTLDPLQWVNFRRSLAIQQATHARNSNTIPHPQLFIPNDDNLVFGPIVAGFSGDHRDLLIFTTFNPIMTPAGYIKDIVTTNYLVDTAFHPPHCSLTPLSQGE